MGKKIVKVLGFLAVLLIAGVLGLGVNPAQAVNVNPGCGATVGPGLVVLTGDVGGPEDGGACSGDGLKLKPGTILDMEDPVTHLGHKIIGDETCSSTGTGIGIQMKYNSTVTGHGEIRGFMRGIQINGTGADNTDNNLIEETLVDANCQVGIILFDSSGNTIRDNTVMRTHTGTDGDSICCAGIDLQNADRNLIQGNNVDMNEGHGIRLQHAWNNTVEYNYTLFNHAGGVDQEKGGGIVCTNVNNPDSGQNFIHGNALWGNFPADQQINELCVPVPDIPANDNIYQGNQCANFSGETTTPGGNCN